MAVGSFHFSLVLLSLVAAVAVISADDRRKAITEVGPSRGKKEEPPRGVFAPRMYYDEWTPLGHGDPLKNDPTYDYVPPVLDHVHYWKEPTQRPSADPPLLGPSLNARRDPPEQFDDPKLAQAPHPSNLFQTLPDVPPTMLVPPPLPAVDAVAANVQPTRTAPTTVVDVEPVNMVLHSSTTISWLDFKSPVSTMSSENPVSSWRPTIPPVEHEPAPLPSITHTSVSPFQRYDQKERPFSPNSIFHKKPDAPVLNAHHKPHFPSIKNVPPPPPVVRPSITIQPGQPFRLPQANTPPASAKPSITEDKESFASLLQSLLDDIPTTTTEPSSRETSTTPPPVATTTLSSVTTDHIFSHYKQPPVPVTAPLYLIIQGHSKVKTYGASKSNPFHEIPHNEVLKDIKSKIRYNRDAVENAGNSHIVRDLDIQEQTLPVRLNKDKSDNSN